MNGISVRRGSCFTFAITMRAEHTQAMAGVTRSTRVLESGSCSKLLSPFDIIKIEYGRDANAHGT